MSTGALDPLIHHPERLRVAAILAALPDGDALAVTRLQDMLGLTSGSLITRRRYRHSVIYQQTPLGTELASGDQSPVEKGNLRSLGPRRP